MQNNKFIFWKIFKIISINILLVLLLIFICDLIIFKCNYKEFKETRRTPIYTYITNNPRGYFIDEFRINYRKPLTENVKNDNAITVFGCSFAYGQYLDDNQIFSYKLHKILERPTYNRAYPGWGIQHMFYQISEDYSFNSTVPKSEYVIYVLMHDHFFRMLIKGAYTYLDDYFYLHYENKNGELKKDNFKNVFLNLLKSCYTFKYFNINHVYNFIKNEKNKEELTDIALLYFLQSRRLLEEKWGKDFKFIVLFYNYGEGETEYCNIRYKEELRKKLEENGFICVDTKDLTNEDLFSDEYKQDNDHPTEKAWDLITPLFVEKLNLK